MTVSNARTPAIHDRARVAPVTAGLIGCLLLGGNAWGQEMLMVTNPAEVPDDQREITVRAAAYAGNDMVPLTQFDAKPWPTNYHTRSGANLAIADGRLDVGTHVQDWQVGYFYREDWLIAGTRDTVDAFALSKRNQLTGQNRDFAIQYNINGFTADGLRIGYARSLPLVSGNQIIVGISASLLRGLSVRRDEAQGELISGATSGDLSGSRQLFNSREEPVSSGSGFNDFIPPQAMSVPQGRGYGFDLGITWLSRNGAKLSLAADDLSGHIHWDRVPLIEQNVDYTGDLRSSPTISGRNSYQALTMPLTPKYQVTGEYPFGRITAIASVEGENGYWFPQVGVGYTLASDWRLAVDYETRFQSFGVTVLRRHYYCSVSTQDVNLASSRAVGVSAGFWFSF